MGAAFHAHATIRIRGIHLEGGGLDARLFGVGGVHDLGLIPIALRPTQVHAQQHLSEVGGIHTARAGADGHHCGTFVIFAVEQGLDFHVGQIVLNAFDFGLRFRQRVGVFFLLTQFHQRFDVVDALACGSETLQLGLHCRQFAGHFLRVFGIVPQSRFGRLNFKIFGLRGQSVDVKRLGNRLVFGARLADCLGKIKFCHRLHHTFLYAFFIFCHGASYGFRTILSFFHVPTYSFPSCRAANQSRYVWDCRSGEDHTGPKASKTCVDSRNNQTQQHRRSDDDAHRPHHGAATAFSLLAFASVVTHGVLV